MISNSHESCAVILLHGGGATVVGRELKMAPHPSPFALQSFILFFLKYKWDPWKFCLLE